MSTPIRAEKQAEAGSKNQYEFALHLMNIAPGISPA
jgi:hypothetical protein